MSWRAQIDDRGSITRYKDTDTGETISAKEYERRQQMQSGQTLVQPSYSLPQMTAASGNGGYVMSTPGFSNAVPTDPTMPAIPVQPSMPASGMPAAPQAAPPGFAQSTGSNGGNPLIQPGAQILTGTSNPVTAGQAAPDSSATAPSLQIGQQAGDPPTAGQSVQGKNLRMLGIPQHQNTTSFGYKSHGFLDATSVAILLPTLVLLALIIAAAHKKRLFPWQTIRTFNPPSGLMSPREYERSFLCPPNLRRHGRLGKRNPNAHWTDVDGIVLPFGFLARTHLPVTIPLGRLPNKNMFIVAPSGSGKTTLMRAVMKALLAKPCVIIALEAKANDPNLDERREGFKYTVLPEAQTAGFKTLYFNPLDGDSIHWNPLDLDPITFSSSIVQDVNSLPPEEQHWAERDHGYISGLATLLKWGAVMVAGEDENGQAADVQPLPCNPRGLMRLVNNRRNIVESLRRLKNNPNVDPAELNELTQTLSSIIRTDTDWDKNIQGVRGRLRMFKNPNVLRVTDRSNVDLRGSMHEPTVLIFGAPASLGPDAESLASCFVYQLQQALHTRYGTASVLPLFAFFDEYQTLNIDIAGRLSAIVRGANGGLTVILQNISQIAGRAVSSDPTAPGGSELKTIFSNSAIRVCLHNADESTAKFFSDEIGKHAVIVPGISDHYDAKGFGIFPSTWNRIHSQQVVARVDTDSIKRMEKQHALVYLSPAGDGEFGEAKPFMCDLRGIEEIARLHLLHNVTGRNQPPAGPAPGSPDGGGHPDMPGQPSPGPATPGFAPAPAPVSARVDRACPHCGQAAGKGRFCIECGRPITTPSAQQAQPAASAAAPAGVVEELSAIGRILEPSAHGQPAGQGAPGFARVSGQAINQASAAGPAPTPGAGPKPALFDNPVLPSTVGSVFGRYNQGQSEAPLAPYAPAQPQANASAPQFPASRSMAPASAPANAEQAMPQQARAPMAQMMQQGAAQTAAPVQPPQPAQPLHPGQGAPQRPAHREVQRPPVTSLSPDPARVGLPQVQSRPAQAPSADNHGQTRHGVEF